jgi:hypothetical protein
MLKFVKGRDVDRVVKLARPEIGGYRSGGTVSAAEPIEASAQELGIREYRQIQQERRAFLHKNKAGSLRSGG